MEDEGFEGPDRVCLYTCRKPLELANVTIDFTFAYFASKARTTLLEHARE